MARVGVVVIHFGAPGPTRDCVEALAAEGSAVERDVVVVDNSAATQPARVQGARVLACPDNPGYGGGANRGIAALGPGPWDALIVLNHDVRVGSGFLDAAVEALALPRAGAAGGPLFLDAARSRLWYAGGGVDYLTGTVRQSRSIAAAQRARWVGFVPGAALAVAERAWHEVGGFDEAFFLYHEDLDLCLRLRRRGFRLRFAPAMAAIHDLGAATGSGGTSPLYLEHLTRTRLRAFRPLAYRLYLAALHSGYVLARACFQLLGGGGSPAARALLRGHRHALATLREGPHL